MLKRNFILLSLVGLVLVISTTFEEENTDVEVLPNNENLDLSIVFENLDANIALTSEEYIVVTSGRLGAHHVSKKWDIFKN